MTDVVAHLTLAASDWLADEPTTWAEGSDMSALTAILVFVFGPILIIGLVTLMVMAPSLAKGPRYRPGTEGDEANASEWFGVLPGDAEPAQIERGTTPQRQLATAASEERLSDKDTGGASARW